MDSKRRHIRPEYIHDGACNRYQRMARLRNQLIRTYRGFNKPTDWILMVDLDIEKIYDAGGIEQIVNAPQDVGAIATYGLRHWEEVKGWRHDGPVYWRGDRYVYYDILAFEDKDRRRMLWKSDGNDTWYPHGNIAAFQEVKGFF